MGRNANLLLNISPNTGGDIDAVDMEAYRALGRWAKATFGTAKYGRSGRSPRASSPPAHAPPAAQLLGARARRIATSPQACGMPRAAAWHLLLAVGVAAAV